MAIKNEKMGHLEKLNIDQKYLYELQKKKVSF